MCINMYMEANVNLNGAVNFAIIVFARICRGCLGLGAYGKNGK